MNLKKHLKSSLNFTDFQGFVLKWYKKQGRKTLPWQKNKTPYRVWVSEIMLQQTQVNTVIPYFERFMKHFPDISNLAKANQDDVLHLWTGLGYYSRARNLHKTACIIQNQFNGEFPDTFEEIIKLPGIGQSTAGAILSIAFKKPTPILDGNVKRVLTRFFAITEGLNEKNTLAKLWEIATFLTPKKNPDHYAQAMMDLGATVCIRGKPFCEKCPLNTFCRARKLKIEKTLPKTKLKKSLPEKQATLFFIQHQNHILLNKRPNKGIWGGLWSPLQIEKHLEMEEIKKHLPHCSIKKINRLDSFRHTFTHFHLDILPIVVSVTRKPIASEEQIWYNLREPQAIGLPAPIQKLLRNL